MGWQGKRNLLAALVVASVILGVVAWQQFAPQPIPPTIVTATPTVTTVLSQTTIRPRLLSMYGKIFFDHNGNGKQDPGEPDMPGVTVALNGRNMTATNGTGWFVIGDLARGNYAIRPFPSRNFRYMCESADEFRSVTDSYEILLSNDTRKDIGLMEGFLTQPYSKIARMYPETNKYRESMNFYDRDGRLDHTKFWDNKQHGYDNHHGTDYFVPYGDDVLAAAPGTVTLVRTGELYISHSQYFSTGYIHISKAVVKVGDRVRRGGKIAECGSVNTPVPHIHFNLLWLHGDKGYFLDPYRPEFTLDDHARGLYTTKWIVPGSRREWIPTFSDTSIEAIGTNYWTVENKPQFADSTSPLEPSLVSGRILGRPVARPPDCGLSLAPGSKGQYPSETASLDLSGPI